MPHRKTLLSPVDLLEDEFAQEKASALGRLGRALVAEASVALWHFVVQREACGLRDMRYVLRDYRVPPEVAARMGALPDHGVSLPGTHRRRQR